MIEREDGAIVIISSVGGYKRLDRDRRLLYLKVADLQLACNLAV